ncbi:hypothetical protein [Aquimarina agarivorans]|uniref:hypothetical protein n=1 Tax=Aquimarina agarivorans TaxID=980584 RepID=UPI000248EDC0|nr:hypothetical protein [Aquimarina agarivorans]
MKNLKLTALAAIVAFSTQVFAANFSVQSTNNDIQLAIEDFLEIDVATLPKLVVEAVQKEHEGATISKAFVNQDGAYKLVLDTQGEDSTILYANAKGEWLDMETKEQE